MDSEYFDRVRTFDLFKGCSEEFVRSFVALAIPKTVAPGTIILQQGEVNERLCILFSGQVQVEVEGEIVAVLDKPGDLMGEISVLMRYPITASLIAMTEARFLEIHAGDLASHILQSENDFGHQLYRAISSVLSSKIIKTNQKARQFEIANRDLIQAKIELEENNRSLDKKVKDRTAELESRSSELMASHKKFEELYAGKELTFQRLKSLQTEHLVPLAHTLQEMTVDATRPQQAKIDHAQIQLASSIEMLRPLSEIYTTEQLIRSMKVLLAEDDRKQQAIAKLALSGTGVQLDVVSAEDQALEFIKDKVHYDIVFVSSKLSGLIPKIAEKFPTAKLVMMASTNIAADIPSLKQFAAHLSTIVSRHSDDRTFTVKNVATTASKLASKDIFGLEKYMNWGVEVISRPVKQSSDRAGLIEEMQKHFSRLGIRSQISSRAASVSEELLMNAIYDAPISADGKSLYNHLPRTEAVHLKPPEFAQYRFACDGMLAAVSVHDPFGGFELKTLLNYLERNYTPTEGNIQEAGKGGAGRGLHQIIENSDLVVFNVHKRIRTEVIAFFNLDPHAIAESAKPSFHFFFR